MTLPAWTEPLLDAAEMRRVDEWAIAEGGAGVLDLMEAAGSALAEGVMRAAPNGPVIALCGKGNNGGDGIVAVRLLRERGIDADALLLGDAAELSEPSAANAERLGGEGLGSFGSGGTERVERADVVIDAIFGTGFSGEPRGIAGDAIEAINASGARVISADIPSGVDASTGEAADLCVRAAATVTFHSAKVGHWIAPGKGLCGELTVAPIGIPEGGPVSPACGLIGEGVLGLVPHRDSLSDKFSGGAVGMFGGSTGLTGALCMAAMAASRSGSGYVTCAVPASLETIFESHLLEQMTAGCPDEGGSFAAGAAERARAALARAGAAVVGPGLGGEPVAQQECRDLISALGCPVLVDAQGLAALAGHLDQVTARGGKSTVLTPHEGEAARLLDRDRADVAARRLESASELARLSGALVVLKGDDTIVTDGSRAAISPGGAPGLATAGSGDVLSGVIAALIARGLEPFEAACAGVFGHLRAGRGAAAALGSADGTVAGDLIEELPRALDGRAGR